MNEELQRVLIQLCKRMAQAKSNQDFDAMDEVRLALKKWNLQGPVPYAELLKEWQIDVELHNGMSYFGASSTKIGQDTSKSEDNPETAPEELPLLSVPDEEETKALILALQDKYRENPEEEVVDDVRREVLAWFKAGRVGPLPCADKLRAWGLWPSESQEGDNHILFPKDR